MKKVAIIGAGICGLSCARELRNAGVSVLLFEKSHRPGGRCATRLWQGHLIDHGAPFLTAKTPDFKREILSHLKNFRPLISAVVDENRRIVPNPSGPRFYLLQGNNFLGHLLSQGLELHTQTRVESVSIEKAGIRCQDQLFSALVSTPPGPQSAQLLGLEKKFYRYDSCLTGLFEYAGRPLDLAKKFYAQQDGTGVRPVQWSGCENHKLGRVVGEKTVFVVQASPRFSEKHLEDTPENYLPLLARENEALWELPSHLLTASFGFRWRYARPQTLTDASPILPPGVFLSGDCVSSASTIEEAWHQGRKMAHSVLDYLVGSSLAA